MTFSNALSPNTMLYPSAIAPFGPPPIRIPRTYISDPRTVNDGPAVELVISREPVITAEPL